MKAQCPHNIRIFINFDWDGSFKRTRPDGWRIERYGKGKEGRRFVLREHDLDRAGEYCIGRKTRRKISPGKLQRHLKGMGNQMYC